MKRIVCGWVVAVGAALIPVCASGEEGTRVYDKPAKAAEEAVTVSDGVAGVAVYGTFPDEKIVLEHLGKGIATLNVRHSVPVKSRTVGYERGLDSVKGRAFTHVKLTEGLRDQEILASGPDSVIVINYGREVPLNCTLALTSEYAGDVRSFDDLITMEGELPGGEPFVTMLKVLPGKGNITTNPDASLTLNHMDGAMMLITTLTGDDCRGDKGLIRLFEATLAAADGGMDGFGKPRGARYTAGSFTVDEKAPGEEYADVTAICSTFYPVERPAAEGEERIVEEWRQMVLRCAPGRIVFVPGTEADHPDGQTASVSLPGDISVVYHWEKGRVTGGYVTYTPSDELYPRETDVELIVNGESHRTQLKAWRPVPMENFVELVRPFIE